MKLKNITQFSFVICAYLGSYCHIAEVQLVIYYHSLYNIYVCLSISSCRLRRVVLQWLIVVCRKLKEYQPIFICDVCIVHRYVRFTMACIEPPSHFPLNAIYICFRRTSFIQNVRSKLGSGSCRWYIYQYFFIPFSSLPFDDIDQSMNPRHLHSFIYPRP